MTFEIIPAIDLRGGRCVRLIKGDFDRETVYSDDPAATAERWLSTGAKRLHVVDLDRAKGDSSINRDAIIAIIAVAQRHGVPVQLGGGMRDIASIDDALSLGIERTIAGTAVVEQAGFLEEIGRSYGKHVAVGIDCRNGMVATRGWLQATELTAETLAARAGAAGVGALIVTDIDRDGMLNGPNIDLVMACKRASGLPVIVSGGISGIDDVIASRDAGADGIITGKAIYDGRLDLAKAIARC